MLKLWIGLIAASSLIVFFHSQELPSVNHRHNTQLIIEQLESERSIYGKNDPESLASFLKLNDHENGDEIKNGFSEDSLLTKSILRP
jgi:hypothetical protein